MENENQLLKDLIVFLKDFEKRTEFLTSNLFEKSQTYVVLIITLGYASFFSIWAFTKDSLPEKTSILIALFMGFSIQLFVVYEIFNMLFYTYLIKKKAESFFKYSGSEDL